MIYGGVLTAVYAVTALIVHLITRDKELLGNLGISALNTLVFAVPYINNNAAYSLQNSIGLGLGAGAAFVLAAALIGSGSRALEKNRHIPPAFRGTPAMFLYVALISLGFTGFTGTALF
jgi:Na+-translocating ferredoxin:NAD+ oxidoreductase RnfA subunit